MTPKPAHDQLPKPPRYLSPASRAWWQRVVEEFELAEHHVHLLTLAAEALDRGAAARRILEKKGLTFRDKHGQPRARPEALIARDAAVSYARLLKELALDGEPAHVRRSASSYWTKEKRRAFQEDPR